MPENEIWNEVAAFLARPDHYGGKTPKLIETHTSRVYVGGDRVLKLKKPGRFDFLDYATIGARLGAGRREVELHRRIEMPTPGMAGRGGTVARHLPLGSLERNLLRHGMYNTPWGLPVPEDTFDDFV